LTVEPKFAEYIIRWLHSVSSTPLRDQSKWMLTGDGLNPIPQLLESSNKNMKISLEKNMSIKLGEIAIGNPIYMEGDWKKTTQSCRSLSKIRIGDLKSPSSRPYRIARKVEETSIGRDLLSSLLKY
jgi:hypothetical protein